MEKITSREQLIDYGERHGYGCLVYQSENNSGLFKSMGRCINTAVEPFMASIYARHDDFKDLPEEFFVDCDKVNHTYIASVPSIDVNIAWAIRNTCINRENFWAFREAVRFVTGDYTPLACIKALSAAGKLKNELLLHFPHASVEDPTMLAYTPSHEYGLRDRQVRIKVGKYLTKYYNDVLTSEQIRAFANGMKGFALKWATDAEEFRYVYEYGPNSCMSGSDFDDIYGDYRPTDVYDTGEFKLAYIEVEHRTILARGFVHEPTKRWVRVYGDEADSLADQLNEMGYTKASSWAGAKLKYIVDDEGQIILPYIDGDARGVTMRNGQWVIVENGCDYYCDFTSGVASREDQSECQDCGDHHHNDDMYYSDYHDRHIGPCCIENYREAYHRSGRQYTSYIHEDECIYCESDDNWYEYNYAVEYMNLVQVSGGEWYSLNDCYETVDGEWEHESDVVNVGDESEDVYFANYHLHTGLVVQYDGATPIKLWHMDHMPEDIHDLYTEDPRITAENGTEMGLRFRTANELLMALGAEHAEKQLRQVGMKLGIYHLETRLKTLNTLAA
jgi:hypothetical protein